MKYWLFFLAKMMIGGAFLLVIAFGMYSLMPAPDTFNSVPMRRFGQDLTWTIAIFLYWLLAVGLLAGIVVDQRYRCRTCARRLRMPVLSGAWDKMLRIGTPQVEYICPYGHGTLNVKLVHFGGRQADDWRANDDNIWRELESLSESSK